MAILSCCCGHWPLRRPITGQAEARATPNQPSGHAPPLRRAHGLLGEGGSMRNHTASAIAGSHAAGISRSSRQRIAIGRSPSWLT